MTVKVSEEYSQAREEFFLKLAIDLGKDPPKVKKKLSEAEILAMQPKSTRAKLTRTYDKEFPNQDDCLAVPGAALGTDESVGMRQLDPFQVSVFERHRRNSKNIQYQSEGSSVSESKREAGINAFVYSQSAQLTAGDISKIKGLIPIKSEQPVIEAPKKKRLWDAGYEFLVTKLFAK